MMEVTRTRRHVGTQGGPPALVRALAIIVGALAVIAVADWAVISPTGHANCLAAEPDDTDERFVVIKAGKIITNAGKEIKRGMIVLSGGKIHNVGRDLEYPLNARVIDARDRVVMPGLIDPRTRFGLDDYTRKGVHGDLTVADEYHPPDDVYDDLLDTGYTALALIPAGGDVPGRAMVVRTAGPDDQRVLSSPAYLRVAADKRAFRGALEKAKAEIEKVEKAREEFEKKQKQEEPGKKPEQGQPESQPASQPTTQPTTQPAFKPPPIDPAHQALVDLIQKKPDIFALIELDSASDFVHMREVLDKFEIAHAFFAPLGRQSDFEYVLDKLEKAGQPDEQKPRFVLTPQIALVPYSAERLNLPRMFSAAGCEVSISPLSDSLSEHGRVLARLAELVREGWSREDALKSVTLHPARLLGLDSRLGTIEKDKEADLIFLDADPFDPAARVREVMIGGEIVHRVEGLE